MFNFNNIIFDIHLNYKPIYLTDAIYFAIIVLLIIQLYDVENLLEILDLLGLSISKLIQAPP